MATPKVYTALTHPNHKLIKAATKKGLTNITITWNPALSSRRGWVIECDQIPWMRIYGDQPMVIKKINSWVWKDNKLRY